MNPFEQLLTDITNPADKEVLGKLSPETQKAIADGVLRQSDYNSRFDHIRSTLRGRTPEEMARLSADWEPWVAGERPEWEKRYKQYPGLESALATAKAEIEALKAATPNSEGQIDTARLSQATKDLLNTELKPRLDGLVTRDELKTLLDTAVKSAVETSWNRTTGEAVPVAMAAQELSNRYYREFGEPLSSDVLVKTAFDNGWKGTEGLQFAFNKLAGPKLEAKRQADFDAKIKAAREEGKLEGQREAQTHGNLPPGMEEGASGFPFAKPLESIDKLPADYELGPKGGYQLAGIAAEELRKLGAARAQG